MNKTLPRVPQTPSPPHTEADTSQCNLLAHPLSPTAKHKRKRDTPEGLQAPPPPHHLHCARPFRYLAWLFKAEALDVAVDPEAWALLTSNFSSGGPGVRFSTQQSILDLHNYNRAVAARDVLATEVAASGAPYVISYDLQDLLSFACVAQHEDAVACVHWPPVALPVTVRADLAGFGMPVDVGALVGARYAHFALV